MFNYAYDVFEFTAYIYFVRRERVGGIVYDSCLSNYRYCTRVLYPYFGSKEKLFLETADIFYGEVAD